jgi:FkbM family methyltransferase
MFHGPSDTQLVATEHGPMYVFGADAYVSRSLALYGEFSGGEIDLFRQLVRPGYTVVEAGANIGSHSLFLARTCAPGRLICFEPQPRTAQLLSANLTMNSITNASVHAAALGEASGWAFIKTLDYSQPHNVGAASLMETNGDYKGPLTRVPLSRLDDWELPALNFLKLDTEGFEAPILRGAAETVRKHRPILYLENDRGDKQAEVIEAAHSLGYDLYWHIVPMFREKNFNRNGDNVFGRTISLNMLGVPSEFKTPVAGLEKVDPHNWRSPVKPG